MAATRTETVPPTPIELTQNAPALKTAFVMTHFDGPSNGKMPINWFHTILLTATPLLAFYGFLTTPIQLPTVIVALVTYYLFGMGITAGYHRFWSHKAFKCKPILELALAICGAAAFEGSIRWWCRNHRAHHRYVDTDKDPYNVIKGFMWAHIGWMIYKQDAKKVGRTDISDLDQDPIVIWQHKNYVLIALISGMIIPTLICGIWGDFRGGYFYAVIARMVFVHHATFFVNSLAHSLGDRPFSDHHTSFDSSITALLTLGEGYHNFHHEFPQDYRNAIEFYQYDPTKWLIKTLSYLGLTYDLCAKNDNEVQKAQIQMQQRYLDSAKAEIEYGSQVENLPTLTQEEVTKQTQIGKQLILIDGYVLNIGRLLDEHPGGRLTLINEIGKTNEETTQNFNTKNKHSLKAQAWMKTMRIAKLK